MSPDTLMRTWIGFVAYLLGSIPFGLVIARLFSGADVRKAGSGNIGATNVARVAGHAAGVLTLLFDVAKGTAAVWIAARFTAENAAWMTLAALAALLGHCFPLWLNFRGGKGVATAAGAFLMLCPPAMGAALLLFILVVAFWRYVSLGSIAAAAAMPLLIYLLWAPRHAPPPVVTWGTLLAAVLIIWKHRSNIERLLAGTEPRFTLGHENKREDE